MSHNIISLYDSNHIITNHTHHFITVMFYKIITAPRLVIFPSLTINFALFRKRLARLVTPLTAQDTNSPRMKETPVDAPHKAVKKA